MAQTYVLDSRSERGNPGDDGVAMGVGFMLVKHSKDNT